MKLKELLEIAKGHLNELTSVESPDFRLEQAEVTLDGVWEIVVSFLVDNQNSDFNKLFSSPRFLVKYNRVYKKLVINQAKEVLGFYIFEDVS